MFCCLCKIMAIFVMSLTNYILSSMCVAAGQYQDPWQYVDDIWLMFNNAWLYNRKTSRVYKYCSKLAEVFEQEIDPVMQSLGYCCGRKVGLKLSCLKKQKNRTKSICGQFFFLVCMTKSLKFCLTSS